LYAVLLGYKESPVAEVRRRHGAAVRALVRSALAVESPDLVAQLGGDIELVVPVPSTSRPGPAVLARVRGIERAVADVRPQARWVPALIGRSTPRGAEEGPVLAHMRPHRAGFTVDADEHDTTARRAVVLDDTYVSGARAQSAAAALRRAGVHAVAIVPLGRVLRPDRVRAHAAFLARHLRPSDEGSAPRRQ